MASNFDGLQVSGNVQGNFKCTWTIKDFSSLDSRVGKSHKSKVFQLEEKGMEWYLKIYPGGKDEGVKGYASCFVHVKNATQNIILMINLSLCNTDTEELFSGVSDVYVPLVSAKKVYYLKTINVNDTRCKLVNDTLVVIFETSYCISCVKDGDRIYHYGETTPQADLIYDWRNLWKNKQNTDCIISVGGEDIPAHSLVLSTRAKVFSDTFEHNKLNNSSRRIEVTNFEKDTINSFMEFLYTGNVRLMDFDLALDLLRASDKYKVSHLKSYCANYLMSLLDLGNACSILASANMHNAKNLQNYAMKYICEKMSEDDLHHQRQIFKDQPELLWGLVLQLIKAKRHIEIILQSQSG